MSDMPAPEGILTIELSLMGSLRTKNPPGGVIGLPAGSTLQHLLDRLGIAVGQVQTICINDCFEHDYQRVLHDQDSIAVLPVTIGHSAAAANKS
jgi:hypothetical protein